MGIRTCLHLPGGKINGREGIWYHLQPRIWREGLTPAFTKGLRKMGCSPFPGKEGSVEGGLASGVHPWDMLAVTPHKP